MYDIRRMYTQAWGRARWVTSTQSMGMGRMYTRDVGIGQGGMYECRTGAVIPLAIRRFAFSRYQRSACVDLIPEAVHMLHNVTSDI